MKSLKSLLIKETVSLKEQYFKMTEAWAIKYFNTCVERSKWNEQAWCKHYGLIPELVNKGTSMEFLSFPRGFYNTKLGGQHHRNRVEVGSVVNQGLNKLIEKELFKANMHYESSISKLAERISKKGLKEENIQVKDGSVGVNINTIITDGVKTVKAFTIVAEGLVQRPHYRYLIK